MQTSEYVVRTLVARKLTVADSCCSEGNEKRKRKWREKERENEERKMRR